MKMIRNAASAAILVLCLVASGTVRCSSWTSDITDFWWNASESGWGVNVTLQKDIAYATFFVYDASHNPVWYSTALNWQGNYVWSGPLFVVQGPWFGGPFNPVGVTTRGVGNATFALNDLGHATLTYSVDGVTVVKNVTRTTWKNEDFTGSYAGGYSIRMSSCFPSYLNGVNEVAGVLNVNQNGTSVSMTAISTSGTCSFAGTYSQIGKLGRVDGSYTCTDGTHGTFSAFEMTATISGFTSRVQGQNQYCQWSGYFGGLARAH